MHTVLVACHCNWFFVAHCLLRAVFTNRGEFLTGAIAIAESPMMFLVCRQTAEDEFFTSGANLSVNTAITTQGNAPQSFNSLEWGKGCRKIHKKSSSIWRACYWKSDGLSAVSDVCLLSLSTGNGQTSETSQTKHHIWPLTCVSSSLFAAAPKSTPRFLMTVDLNLPEIRK